MVLAQAVNGTIQTGPATTSVVPTGVSFLGFSGTQLIVGLIILAVVLLVIWALVGTRDRYYYRDGSLAGAKGGRVKKVTEYEDDEDIDDDIV